MASANPFGSNQNITLERNRVITLTKRTVRFSSNIYQTRNITGFSEGEVDIGTIPWGIIILVFIISPIIGLANSTVGGFLVLAAIAGAVWNFIKPKHYGLLFILNSGDKKLFITTDKSGLRKVIEGILSLIESEKDRAYEISINNSQVNGNFIQGDARDVSYRSLT